ncbi:MAG: hypothetical protein JXQ72_12075, partial [Anaerolineae bacterium]|nr:hypothetical protein [Anaerolineae bacterium]
QLRRSALYREDQHSYILYPDRDLPGFLEKNAIDADAVRDLGLVAALAANHDTSLFVQDANGTFHFSGDIRNAQDVARALADLAEQPRYAGLVAADSSAILALFERTFNHAAFTGRSGSFFAYEGLGSIYWHMVSKLLLAVQETVQTAARDQASGPMLHALIEVYYDIRAGLGFNKTPDVYGAFPTDPYSHTPGGQGAKQPGMTGMVKEEILTRLGEVGLNIDQGQISFSPVLLHTDELLSAPSVLRCVDVDGQESRIDVPANALAFTFCQVPVIVQLAGDSHITLTLHDGSTRTIPDSRLSPELSRAIFSRDGTVRWIVVSVPNRLEVGD